MSNSRKDSKGRVLLKGEGEQADGRYYYQFYDITRKRKKIYANSLKELRQKKDYVNLYRIQGIDIYAKDKITLNECFNKYIRTSSHLKRNTVNTYIYLYVKYVKDNIGKLPIGKIKYSVLKEFFIDIRNKNKIKKKTLLLISATIGNALALAIRDELIQVNPIEHVIRDIQKDDTLQSRCVRALTKKEQTVFMNYIKDSPIYFKWLPMFTVFLGTGMRAGELFGLTKHDIDFKRKIISVNHSLGYNKDANGYCSHYINSTKSKQGTREIPMIDDVYMAIEYLTKHTKKKLKIDGYSDFIFLNKNGNLYTNGNINKLLKDIIKSYNKEEQENAKNNNCSPFLLPDFSLHTLRHTFCTRFCEVESNIKVISDIMGHKDINTTVNIYADAHEDIKNKAISKLNKIITI